MSGTNLQLESVICNWDLLGSFSSLRVVDPIFTRIGTGDNLVSNSSMFMTEMKETAFLIQNVSPRSLIVMDELGRATSSADGFAVAWSCCEHLLALKALFSRTDHDSATLWPPVGRSCRTAGLSDRIC